MSVIKQTVPSLQIPESGVIARPGVGWFWCHHKWVVLQVLLSVGYQTDAQTCT